MKILKIFGSDDNFWVEIKQNTFDFQIKGILDRKQIH